MVLEYIIGTFVQESSRAGYLILSCLYRLSFTYTEILQCISLLPGGNKGFTYEATQHLHRVQQGF